MPSLEAVKCITLRVGREIMGKNMQRIVSFVKKQRC